VPPSTSASAPISRKIAPTVNGTRPGAIRQNGFTLHKEYIDEARRGWDDTRPEFRQLLSDAKAGKFDVILVDECSRLSRNEPVEFFGEVVYPLKRVGVRLYSVSEGGLQDWNNLPGILLSAVYQDRSAGESKKTAWRVTSNYQKLAGEGRIDLGKPPYGYKRVRNPDGRFSYIPDADNPSHAETVRFVFDAYANRDISLRDIDRELERKGVPTPAGKTVWSQNCVRKILRDMKYAGHFVFNRTRQGRFCRLGVDGVEQTTGQATKSAVNLRELWRVIPNHHEPLVPPDLFERVQDLLSRNRTRTTPAPNRGDFLFGGLLVCGACGGPMSGHRNGPGKPTFYRCTRAMGTAQNHCHNNLVKESEVLDHALGALEGMFLSPSFMSRCLKVARELEAGASDGKRIQHLRSELDGLDKDIARVRNRPAKVDDETFDFLNRQIGGWGEWKKELEAELAKATAPDIEDRVGQTFDRLKGELAQLRATAQCKDAGLLRAALRNIIEWAEVSVEKRLVGRVKHRYFLVGGRVMLRAGDRFDTDGPKAGVRRAQPHQRCRLVSTGIAEQEGEGAGADTTENLSLSG
jgi:site-specific DNA recombinase